MSVEFQLRLANMMYTMSIYNYVGCSLFNYVPNYAGNGLDWIYFSTLKMLTAPICLPYDIQIYKLLLQHANIVYALDYHVRSPQVEYF